MRRNFDSPVNATPASKDFAPKRSMATAKTTIEPVPVDMVATVCISTMTSHVAALMAFTGPFAPSTKTTAGSWK